MAIYSHPKTLRQLSRFDTLSTSRKIAYDGTTSVCRHKKLGYITLLPLGLAPTVPSTPPAKDVVTKAVAKHYGLNTAIILRRYKAPYLWYAKAIGNQRQGDDFINCLDDENGIPIPFLAALYPILTSNSVYY